MVTWKTKGSVALLAFAAIYNLWLIYEFVRYSLSAQEGSAYTPGAQFAPIVMLLRGGIAALMLVIARGLWRGSKGHYFAALFIAWYVLGDPLRDLKSAAVYPVGFYAFLIFSVSLLLLLLSDWRTFFPRPRP